MYIYIYICALTPSKDGEMHFDTESCLVWHQSSKRDLLRCVLVPARSGSQRRARILPGHSGNPKQRLVVSARGCPECAGSFSEMAERTLSTLSSQSPIAKTAADAAERLQARERDFRFHREIVQMVAPRICVNTVLPIAQTDVTDRRRHLQRIWHRAGITGTEPKPICELTFGAFCLDVRTLTLCQLMGFPLDH